MIIIKIIILYFIQITHTDDFPSTDTRLVAITASEARTTKSVTTASNDTTARVPT